MKVCSIGLSTQRPPAPNMLPSGNNPLAKHPATRTYPSTPPWGKTPTLTLSSNLTVNHSDITSKLDGHSLGEMEQVWKDVAASEARMNSLETLNKKKLDERNVISPRHFPPNRCCTSSI